MQSVETSEFPTDLDSDLQRLRQLLVELGRTACLRDPLAGASEQLDLTAPQMHALLSLGNDAGLTMGELSRRGGISEKTMTGVVDRLEQAGHVRRERDPADRRLVRVVLTDQGRGLFEACDAHLAGRLRHFLALLEPDDRTALLRMLDRLNARLAGRIAAAGEERT